MAASLVRWWVLAHEVKVNALLLQQQQAVRWIGGIFSEFVEKLTWSESHPQLCIESGED